MRACWVIVFLLATVTTTSVAISQGEVESNPAWNVHSINAPMGILDPVGHYDIRFNVFRQEGPTGSLYDVSGHASYGLFDWGGIHLRSLGLKTGPLTEIIGMVGLWGKQDRSLGVTLLGILGIPTGTQIAGEHHGLSYLFGVAGRWRPGDVVSNDFVFHYDFTAGHWIAETGTVVRLSNVFYYVIDTRVTVGNIRPEILFLTAVKTEVLKNSFVGLGYQVPVSRTKPFANQIYLQLEVAGH